MLNSLYNWFTFQKDLNLIESNNCLKQVTEYQMMPILNKKNNQNVIHTEMTPKSLELFNRLKSYIIDSLTLKTVSLIYCYLDSTNQLNLLYDPYDSTLEIESQQSNPIDQYKEWYESQKPVYNFDHVLNLLRNFYDRGIVGVKEQEVNYRNQVITRCNYISELEETMYDNPDYDPPFGDFSWVVDEEERNRLTDVFQATIISGVGISFFNDQSIEYMKWSDNRLYHIYAYCRLKYSPAVFNQYLYKLREIVTKGWKTYRDTYLFNVFN